MRNLERTYNEGTDFKKRVNLSAWTSKLAIPLALADMPAVVYNNRIYTFGGYGTSSADCHDDCFEYIPSCNSWASKTGMPTARWGAAAGLCDGKAYVLGGSDSSSRVGSKNECFDIARNSWTAKPELPAHVSGEGQMAASVNSKIYIFLGVHTYEYNPVLNSYTRKANAPIGRTWGCCGVVNVEGEDRIYIIGGYRTLDSQPSNDNYYYVPRTDTWSPAQTVAPFSAWGVLRDNPVIDEKIFYGFGFTGRTFSKRMFCYDSLSNSWSVQLTSAAHKRDGLACGVVGGKLYAIGGRDKSPNPHGLNYNEEFNPLEQKGIISRATRARALSLLSLTTIFATVPVIRQHETAIPESRNKNA